MPKVRQYAVIAIISLLGCVITAAATVSVYGSKQTIPAGVTLSGWSIGGMTFTEWERQLSLQTGRVNERVVNLQLPAGAPAHASWTLQQLGLSSNAGQLQHTLDALRIGSLWDRAKARWAMRNQALTFETSLDAAALKQTVRQIWAAWDDKQPVNAQRVVGEDDTIGYIPEHNVERIDYDKLYELVKQTIPPFHAAEPTMGPATVRVPLTTAKPAVTMESLKAQRIDRKLTEFTTYAPPQNSAGRIHNVRSTAASIQDVVLKPGEIFDYSKFIELTETKYGFQEAPVIVNGKLVPGIGGGICQVSSTLYNAVLLSGLKIVERRNHSLPISYVPLGQDATFASGFINFRFQNTTGAYLLIRSATTDNQVTIKLFGNAPANVTYEVESRTLETLKPPVKYVHNPQLKVGKTELLSNGKPGYVVETRRVKKVDGLVTASELISKDTYSAQPTLIAVNNGKEGEVTPPGENTTPYVEDGVKGPVYRTP